MQEVQVVAVSLFDTLTQSWSSRYPRLDPPLAMSDFLRDIQLKYTLQDLICWMDGVIRNWLEQARKETAEKKTNKLVIQVKRYVEEHYAEEISFEAIARGCTFIPNI